ncbi:MAG: radical SAM protein [Candidatus Omnitrophica bacterium]|nr:radical SAM protein [Candidatus Omnitrophota bacterium]
MKFVLVQAPFKNFAVTSPPLGLAYLAAVLKNKPAGAEVSVIDANVARLSVERTAQRILDMKPDVLGMTMTSPLAAGSFDIIERVKSKVDIPVLAGGPHPTIMPEDVLKQSKVDIVVRGEGEETIAELCDYFRTAKDIASIKGISFKDGDKVLHNADRPLIQDMDRLPFPAWELFPLEQYSSIAGRGRLSVPVMTSRGCPFRCIFCYKGIFGQTYRSRSPQSVMRELRYLADTLKIREFSFVDDSFAVDEARAIGICDEMIKSGLRLPWRLANGIAVRSSSSRLFMKAKEAGCYQVSIGVESGNQGVLNHIEKGVTLDEIRQTFILAKEAGLETIAFFMIGNLGETEETMEQTVDFAIRLDPDFAQFTIATPYPGTKMREIIRKEGELLSDNWEKYVSCSGNAVFRHKELEPGLMKKKYREAYRRFYLRPGYIIKRLKKIATMRGLKSGLEGISLLFKMALGRR